MHEMFPGLVGHCHTFDMISMIDFYIARSLAMYSGASRHAVARRLVNPGHPVSHQRPVTQDKLFINVDMVRRHGFNPMELLFQKYHVGPEHRAVRVQTPSKQLCGRENKRHDMETTTSCHLFFYFICSCQTRSRGIYLGVCW